MMQMKWKYIHKSSCKKPFDAVVSERRTYPITEDEPEEKHTYLSYNKVVGTVLDRELYQAFSVLDYVLVSAPGAPVRQALIDAGIGEDVYGSFEDGMLQPMFSIVAKNADESDQTRFCADYRGNFTEAGKGRSESGFPSCGN